MKTALNRKFWLICFIWTCYHITDTITVDTATTEQIPAQILQTLKDADPSEVRNILNNTRRIILGRETTNSKPYMVYLKLPSVSNVKYRDYKTWLCGGVIVHPEYIITSAACIEDVRHFYVVSGTFKFSFDDDRYNNPCIKNGAKKAIWKCIPKNYVFDGHENDNIRWMNNDIAVVKLEDELDFGRRVRGCDYIPRPVMYNNQSITLEEYGKAATVAGWGSTDRYNDWVNSRRADDSKVPRSAVLLEASVTIMGKQTCKKRWGKRYSNIIENYMICTKDLTSELTEVCMEKYVDCRDILGESSEEANPAHDNRRHWDPTNMVVHSAHHDPATRRFFKDGGFCENDHGGPLVVGDGLSAVVIGIISACLVKERTNKCYGPFLYTSVFKNRKLINCAIYKNAGSDCNKMFRSGDDSMTEMEMSWADHPDGPAKNEVKALRRQAEKQEEASFDTNSTNLSESIRDNNTIEVNRTIDSENVSPKIRAGVEIMHGQKDELKNNSKAIEHASTSENTTMQIQPE